MNFVFSAQKKERSLAPFLGSLFTVETYRFLFTSGSFYFFARSIFILPTSQNRHSSSSLGQFYFTDESEPSLVIFSEARNSVNI